jgi:signal transduction histidine kinase/Na+/proline symporter
VALSAGVLLAATLAYLAVLFLLASATERGLLPARLARHPATYALSLGVYASSWTYYGSVGFAERHGLSFLAIYLGPTLAGLAVPAIFLPVLRLSRDYQLGSLADLFAFRFQRRRVGAVVTVFALVASIPYLAQQIRAVAESARVVAPGTSADVFGLGFAALITLFTVLFGARHLSPREPHQGLAVAIAFESVVKLVALLAVGAAALFSVLEGPAGLDAHLAAHPEALASLTAPVRDGTGWTSLLVLSFAAAFLLPRQFHVAFAEAPREGALRTAAWGFPLYLLLLNLGILPILWAGLRLAPDAPADLWAVALPRALGSPALTLVAFLGGVSASSAMVIVTTIPLAGMCLNHLVLPARLDVIQHNAYARVLWLRRVLIAAIVLSGYAFFVLQARRGPLVETGLVSFVAFAQLLPGLLALLFWKRATRAGFLAGLGAGAALWVTTALLPLLARSGFFRFDLDLGPLLGAVPGDTWTAPTVLSLTANTLLLGLVSLATTPGADEAEAARIATGEALAPSPLGVAPFAPTAAELTSGLTRVLGHGTAQSEVARALVELDVDPDRARPLDLARVRERVERNLSGLFGPVLARMALSHAVRAESDADQALADQLRFLEIRLRDPGAALQGPAAQLDLLRRYLRSVLEELPVGVCALGPDGGVVIYNRALARTTGLSAEDASGAPLARLPAPWGAALAAYVEGHGPDEVRLDTAAGPRALRFTKAEMNWAGPAEAHAGGLVLVVEDRTEREALRSGLAHKDRLATVGRFAAGIAHEVGNPLTGIACLAQNLGAEGDLGPEARERAASILEQVGRIDGIVRSLLAFSHQGEGGAAPRRAERVALDRVVDDAVRLVRLDRASRAVGVESVCPEDLWVRADATRLTQIFVNLLTNACDASPPGGGVLVDAERAGAFVVARVVDHGAGIPASLRERIFEPFFTTKAPGEGTGLGLSLVYGLVEELGGTVTVESEVGVGTIFTVRLPVAPAPGEDGAEAPVGLASRA